MQTTITGLPCAHIIRHYTPAKTHEAACTSHICICVCVFTRLWLKSLVYTIFKSPPVASYVYSYHLCAYINRKFYTHIYLTLYKKIALTCVLLTLAYIMHTCIVLYVKFKVEQRKIRSRPPLFLIYIYIHTHHFIYIYVICIHIYLLDVSRKAASVLLNK